MNANYVFKFDKTLEAPELDEIAPVRFSQEEDQEMFARLYQANVDRIYRYVYFRVADDDLAQDITSQIFMKVWEKLDTYQAGQSPFMAWIYRIARNTVIDYYRTKKFAISIENVRPLELSYDDDMDEKLDFQIQSQKLRAALRELTKEQRQVLVLKFVGGLSTIEIAKKLKKQTGAIRALQMRGLQGLAKCPNIQREQFYMQ